MALTYNNAFEIELRSMVEAEIKRLAETLATGAGAPDYPSYQRAVGKIEGLRMALDCCDEAHNELEKR